MDKVTHSNAASAEESASAAEELNAQAENLKDAVFQLLRLVDGNNAGAIQSAEARASARTRKSAAKPSWKSAGGSTISTGNNNPAPTRNHADDDGHGGSNGSNAAKRETTVTASTGSGRAQVPDGFMDF